MAMLIFVNKPLTAVFYGLGIGLMILFIIFFEKGVFILFTPFLTNFCV